MIEDHEGLYVVRSTDIEPLGYAVLPTLADAKSLIDGLEELFGEGDFDYDTIPFFENAETALEYIRQTSD